eukprot:Clim_evm16s99 gene=Clim_evmTU16s99
MSGRFTNGSADAPSQGVAQLSLDTGTQQKGETIVNTWQAPSRGQWCDAAKEFLEACEGGLVEGEMVCTTRFNLMEAMSAPEAMNVKMDAGVRKVGETRIGGVAKAISRKWIKIQDFTPLEYCYVMDRLLHNAIEWRSFTGHPGQTIYACLYLHEPSKIVDPLMKSLMCGIASSLAHIIELTRYVGLYEEEDLILPTVGMQMPDPGPQGPLLKECEELLMQKRDEAEARVDLGRPDAWQWQALRNRCDAYLVVCRSLLRIGSYSLQGQNTLEDAQQFLAQVDAVVEKDLEAIGRVLEDILLTPEVEDRVWMSYPTFHGINIWLGWDPTANRHLISPMPPRLIERENCRFVDSVARWAEDIKDWHVGAQLDVFAVGSSVDFLYYIIPKRSPDILSRSLYCTQLSIYPAPLLGRPPQPIVSDPEPVVCDIHAWCGLPLVINSTTGLLKPFTDSPLVTSALVKILDSITNQMLSTLKVLCANRGRQRRKAVHLLRQWEELSQQVERDEKKMLELIASNVASKSPAASVYEGYFNADGAMWMPLYQYTIIWKVYVMQLVIFLGFELECYHQREYSEMLWWAGYLTDFEYRLHLAAHQRRQDLRNILERLNTENVAEAMGKPRHLGLKTKLSCKLDTAGRLQRSGALANMTRAYNGAVDALLNHGFLTVPKIVYKVDRARYDHRMAPFFTVHNPEPVGYDDLVNAKDAMAERYANDLNGLSEAVEMFDRSHRRCRAIIDDIRGVAGAANRRRLFFVEESVAEDYEALAQVCKANSVALKLAMMAQRTNKLLPMVLTHDHHPQLPSLKVLKQTR